MLCEYEWSDFIMRLLRVTRLYIFVLTAVKGVHERDSMHHAEFWWVSVKLGFFRVDSLLKFLFQVTRAYPTSTTRPRCIRSALNEFSAYASYYPQRVAAATVYIYISGS